MEVYFRYVANRYLLANPKSNIDVEWAYCFDVHLNAVLPLLAILHVGQLPFLNCKHKIKNLKKTKIYI